MANFIEMEKKLWQGGIYNKPENTTGPIEQDATDWVLISLVSDRCPVSANNFTYLSCPLVDNVFPGIPWLKMMVACMESFAKAKMNMYVHCGAGMSRSVMLVAAYFMKRYNWTLDATMEYIKQRNPSADPAPEFMEGLKKWEVIIVY